MVLRHHKGTANTLETVCPSIHIKICILTSVYALHAPKKTVCMKCQSLFSRKNKKYVENLSFAELVKM